MAGSPTVRRRRLAAELRRLREAAGLTIEDAAAAAEISKSALSRIENGLVGAKVPIVRALVRAYEVTDAQEETLVQLARDAAQRGWWQSYDTELISDMLAAFVSFEAEARSIRTYEPFVIPGLLQTGDYAAALFRSLRDARSAEEIDRRVAIRLKRQDHLKDLHLWAIIEESVLRRRIGGSVVLKGQLIRLLEVFESPNIDLQVLPITIGAHAGMEGAFALLDFPEDTHPPIAYAETSFGMLWLDKQDEVRRLGLAFDRLRAAALSSDASREFIAKVIEEIEDVAATETSE